jgi:hypothetical protein
MKNEGTIAKSFSNSAPDGGKWSSSLYGNFTLPENSPQYPPNRRLVSAPFWILCRREKFPVSPWNRTPAVSPYPVVLPTKASLLQYNVILFTVEKLGLQMWNMLFLRNVGIKFLCCRLVLEMGGNKLEYA